MLSGETRHIPWSFPASFSWLCSSVVLFINRIILLEEVRAVPLLAHPRKLRLWPCQQRMWLWPSLGCVTWDAYKFVSDYAICSLLWDAQPDMAIWYVKMRWSYMTMSRTRSMFSGFVAVNDLSDLVSFSTFCLPCLNSLLHHFTVTYEGACSPNVVVMSLCISAWVVPLNCRYLMTAWYSRLLICHETPDTESSRTCKIIIWPRNLVGRIKICTRFYGPNFGIHILTIFYV